MKNNGISFIVGFIFALGLGISGMTKPTYVQGFLNAFKDWNLTLVFVMIGAILTHGVFYSVLKKRARPIFDLKFHIPTRKDIDVRLILGSVIFGVGWGVAGFCPGPALVSLATGELQPFIFVGSMILGMYLFRLVAKVFKIS